MNTKIKDIGGEFSLIHRLSRIAPGTGPHVIKGIGDDAAVLRVAGLPAPYLLVTADILVEDRHFSRQWSAPEHIGIKAAECNLSDIAAMGGTPQWMFVSIVLSEQEEVAWVEGLYRGLGSSCRSHGVALLGGDTTRGPCAQISVTVIGSVVPEQLCLRSHARPGDLLVVTGTLGASAAALALIQAGHQPSDYLLAKFRTPRCRLDVSGHIAPLARAMIDISDGLGSEVHHICSQSNVGAQIDASAIALHADVKAAAHLLDCDPLQWAISGGEDFELLFSITPENLEQLKAADLGLHTVGRVTDQPDTRTLVLHDGKKLPLARGYDHFS
jgi:thiamine-monophosphate kinase